MTKIVDSTQTPHAHVFAALGAYAPIGIDEAVWHGFFTELRVLVLAAGPQTRVRVMRDIKLLGAVARFLIQQGQPLTAGTVLADTTLLAFDQHQASAGLAAGTRQNNRAILRRLQAAQRGAPSPSTRRSDGDRMNDLPGPESASLVAVVEAAALSSPDDAAAAGFLSVLTAERRNRRRRAADPAMWSRAKAFAGQHGLALSRSLLSAAVTHEVLALPVPLAELILRHGLTRVDLDLGLTHARDLPESPTGEARAALRGSVGMRRPGD